MDSSNQQETSCNFDAYGYGDVAVILSSSPKDVTDLQMDENCMVRWAPEKTARKDGNEEDVSLGARALANEKMIPSKEQTFSSEPTSYGYEDVAVLSPSPKEVTSSEPVKYGNGDVAVILSSPNENDTELENEVSSDAESLPLLTPQKEFGQKTNSSASELKVDRNVIRKKIEDSSSEPATYECGDVAVMLSSSPKGVTRFGDDVSLKVLTKSVMPKQDQKKDDSSASGIIGDTSHSDNAFKPSAKDEWRVFPASSKSLRTRNPIRAIVDPIVASMQQKKNAGRDVISLALGDPTAFGNLPPCPVAIQAVVEAAQSFDHAAPYVSACGTEEARKAIANFHHNENSDNVIVANGCSGALELAITALMDGEESILLVPEPGFPLYQVIAESHGACVRHYKLLSNKKWECDLMYLRILMDELLSERQHRRIVLVVNNPSNPTGAVFAKKHLQEVVSLCQEFKTPILADEVYGDLTFGDNVFYPLSNIAAEMGRQVPVITSSGLAKQFLLPGWRVGWIVFQDNMHGSLKEVKKGAQRLAQIVLGSSHLVQKAIPKLLQPESKTEADSIEKWKFNLRKTLSQQAAELCTILDAMPGIRVMAQPAGAMYAMVQINIEVFDQSITNDVEFTKKLLEEEQVFVLPGSCFIREDPRNICLKDKKEYFFRVVFCAPVQVLKDATDRIRNFCHRHVVS